MAEKALAECEAQGLDVLVTCTWRSDEEQESLYAQGRTKPGRRVTNARAGQSAHNYTINGVRAALGMDIVPMRHGKLVWGLEGDGIDYDPSDDDKDDLELWQRIRAVFESNGFESASRWKGFREWPHFQHPATSDMLKRRS